MDARRREGRPRLCVIYHAAQAPPAQERLCAKRMPARRTQASAITRHCSPVAVIWGRPATINVEAWQGLPMVDGALMPETPEELLRLASPRRDHVNTVQRPAPWSSARAELPASPPADGHPCALAGVGESATHHARCSRVAAKALPPAYIEKGAILVWSMPSWKEQSLP